MDIVSAAHHEAAHAVVSVALGLPLQDTGIHLDTAGGGITFHLHRIPGDPANTPADIVERERSIIAIKAGYAANLRLLPGTPPIVAADDRNVEVALLNEMYQNSSQNWIEADTRLATEAQKMVEQHWKPSPPWQVLSSISQRLCANLTASENGVLLIRGKDAWMGTRLRQF